MRTGSVVPRTIFQTWRSKTALPQDVEPYVARLRHFCNHHGFEHVLVNDEEMTSFVRASFPGYLPVYESLETVVERTDLWRYLILLRHGGFYLDLDCEITEAFVRVTDHLDKPLVQVECDKWLDWARGVCHLPQIGQFFLGFPAGSPILEEVVAEVVRRLEHRPYRRLGRYQEILFTTGPGAFGEVVCRHRARVHFFRVNQLVVHHTHGNWVGGLNRGPLRWLWRRCSVPYVR